MVLEQILDYNHGVGQYQPKMKKDIQLKQKSIDNKQIRLKEIIKMA